MQIRCTQKLLKEIGAKSNDPLQRDESNSILGDWYANIFTLDRRKTIIFMNERTLLSFIIYGVRKDNIQKFPIMFLAGVEKVLALEGIEERLILKILMQYEQIEITKTMSKSLLGSMNDLVFLYTHFILSSGGLKVTDLNDVIYRINRTPQKNLSYVKSAEMLRQLVIGNIN